MTLTIPQCRAARALLNWSAADLATAAGIGVATVRRFEGGLPVAADSADAMRTAFDVGGVELLAAGARSKGGGPGVRLQGDAT